MVMEAKVDFIMTLPESVGSESRSNPGHEAKKNTSLYLSKVSLT